MPEQYKYGPLMDELDAVMGNHGGGNNIFGNSYFNQFNSAKAGLKRLDELNEAGKIANDVDVDSLRGNIKATKMQAGIGAGLAAAQGIIGMGDNFMSAASIQDTTQQQAQIDQLARLGNQNYNSIEQLAADMGTARGVDINYDDIRGMGGKGVTMEKVSAIGSSALQGASAGMQIGGPWGAAIGGAIGIGTGLAGVLTGDTKARIKEEYLRSQADRATNLSNLNFQAGVNELAEREYRDKASNVVAKGGIIVRNDRREPVRYTMSRKYCKGGVRIRFNKK